ncbi:MAG TPA: sulfatase [Chitinophagaceae bacterium]|nr:sulfatase [Chitinophagaceae bacterium]
MMKYFLLLLSPLFSAVLAAQSGPNIVLIISDDHAYQAISAYGGRLMQTPGIDRIAAEGVRFDKAYVTNSICGPSRAVMLTGKYSHKNGFKDNETSRFDASQNSFIKELTKSGYQTAWIGKYHLGEKPEGFTYWQLLPGQGSYYNPDFLMMDGSRKRVEGYVTNVVEDAAESWLSGRDTSRPFCLVIGHKNTHRTWMPDLQDLGMFDNTHFPLPANFYDDYKSRPAAAGQDMTIEKTMRMDYDLKMFASREEAMKQGSIARMTEAQREKYLGYYEEINKELQSKSLSGRALTEWKYQRYMRDYLATAASLDRNIGRTLDYLDKNGLTGNTIVIYVSDQGFYMGEHGWFDKRWMYEESFRTPMVMRYPGKIEPGSVNKDMVLNLDIPPTLLQAAGVAIPADMQGESFLPLVSNEKMAGKKGRKAIYYHYYENGEHAVSPHFGVSTGRYKLIRFYKRTEGWELYDMKKDPAEMNNVYPQKKYRDKVKKLKKELLRLIRKYEDTEAAALMDQ